MTSRYCFISTVGSTCRLLFTYTEKELGGELPIEALYNEPYMQNLVRENNGWMLMPPIPFSFRSADKFLQSAAPAQPSLEHWLGTDDSGKDTLARLIYGFRLSVLFGLSLTIMSSMIGVTVGAVQGYFGGRIDLIGQRLVEIWDRLADSPDAYHPGQYCQTQCVLVTGYSDTIQLDATGQCRSCGGIAYQEL